MTKIILTMLAAVFLSSCASSQQLSSVQIIDSNGLAYESSNISQALKNQYALESPPLMILLLTSRLDNSQFIEQLKNLNRVNAETYQYLFVVGCKTERDNSGYNISREAAANILSGADFKIHIYDGNGSLAYSSKKVLSEQELKDQLIQNSIAQ